jgi:hypothetical protein
MQISKSWLPTNFFFQSLSADWNQLDGDTYVIDPDGPGPGLPVEFDNRLQL